MIAFTYDKSSTKPLNSSTMQHILNDTSLAAVALSNGDRHLFFQDPGGSIRRVIRRESESQWILDARPVDFSDARHLTPMAVELTHRPFEVSGDSGGLVVGIGYDGNNYILTL